MRERHTRKLIAPNTVLPEGATRIPTVNKTLAGRVEMPFDARVERFGLTWYRVAGGMGEPRNDSREDWCCDIPSGGMSVHDYQWREPRWGLDKFKSFDEAVIAEMKRSVRSRKDKAAEYRESAKKAEQAVKLMTAALAQATTPKPAGA